MHCTVRCTWGIITNERFLYGTNLTRHVHDKIEYHQLCLRCIYLFLDHVNFIVNIFKYDVLALFIYTINKEDSLK